MKPSPQDKEPQDLWSPNDRQSPYYVWHMMTDEEWLVVSRSYPFSIRVLVQLYDETRWSEHGRTQTEEQAKNLMHGLARLHSNKDWWIGWIVTESTCTGSQVREKPVLWYPSQARILETCAKSACSKPATSLAKEETMKKVQQQPSWLLWGRDITIAAGMLIEYQDVRRIRIARVEQVRVVSVPPYTDTQVIDVKLYGPLARQDGPRTRTVQPEKVLRVLDAPPPPPAKALTSLWSPRDENNPFRVESPLSNEEWREIARWYPFSLRVLVVVQGGDATWHEEARTRTWEQAKEAMQTLAEAKCHKDWLAWVVMKCELRGKEGREKPVLWYPGPGSVQATLREVGLIKREL